MKRVLVLMTAVVVLGAFYMGCQKMEARCKYCGKVVKVTTLRGVHFDFNKYQLRKDGMTILAEDVELLKKDKKLVVSIEGHTDSIGSDEYNQVLSVRRATTVFNYLIDKGVAADRMQILGFGEKNPIASNSTATGREQNRRVELKIIQPDKK